MIILLDTHIALWSLYDDSRLGDLARNYLIDNRNTVYYSLVSAWEIEIKHSLGKINVPSDIFIQDCDALGFTMLSIRKEHILALKDLPFPNNGHKDPFDRLLISQAEFESYYLLTQDNKILAYQNKYILSGK